LRNNKLRRTLGILVSYEDLWLKFFILFATANLAPRPTAVQPEFEKIVFEVELFPVEFFIPDNNLGDKTPRHFVVVIEIVKLNHDYGENIDQTSDSCERVNHLKISPLDLDPLVASNEIQSKIRVFAPNPVISILLTERDSA
jgi:hypothetical protein